MNLRRGEKELIIPDQKIVPFCNNEYGKLEKVVVCPPKYLRIDEIINETQRYYKNNNMSVNTRKAVKQFNHFIEVLQSNGVEIITLTPVEQCNEQVFVRDIGFVIGNRLFVSRMKHQIRCEETQVLVDELQLLGLPFYRFQNPIEGGDIIVDQNVVFIGRSMRTNEEGIRELRKVLPHYQIKVLGVNPPYLHLDCLFNIISSTEAIIYRAAFDESSLQMLEKHYALIDVSKEEQFALGPNVLSLGDKKIISDKHHCSLNSQLKKRGYHVIELDYSEMRKSGGAFRCTSLPLSRT